MGNVCCLEAPPTPTNHSSTTQKHVGRPRPPTDSKTEIEASIQSLLLAVGSPLTPETWSKDIVCEALKDLGTGLEEVLQSPSANNTESNLTSSSSAHSCDVSGPHLGPSSFTIQVPPSTTQHLSPSSPSVRVTNLFYFLTFQPSCAASCANTLNGLEKPTPTCQTSAGTNMTMPLVPELRRDSDDEHQSLNDSLDRAAPPEAGDDAAVTDAFEFAPTSVVPTHATRRRSFPSSSFNPPSAIGARLTGSNSKRRRGSKSVDGSSRDPSRSDGDLGASEMAAPTSQPVDWSSVKTIVVPQRLEAVAGENERADSAALLEMARFFAVRVLRGKVVAAQRKSLSSNFVVASQVTPLSNLMATSGVIDSPSFGGHLGSESTGGGFPRFGHLCFPLPPGKVTPEGVAVEEHCRAVFMSHDDAIRDRLVTGVNLTSCREGVLVEGVLYFTSTTTGRPNELQPTEMKYHEDKCLDIYSSRVKTEGVVRNVLHAISAGTK